MYIGQKFIQEKMEQKGKVERMKARKNAEEGPITKRIYYRRNCSTGNIRSKWYSYHYNNMACKKAQPPKKNTEETEAMERKIKMKMIIHLLEYIQDLDGLLKVVQQYAAQGLNAR